MTLRLPLLALALLAAVIAFEDTRAAALAAAGWIVDGFLFVFVDAANYISGCF